MDCPKKSRQQAQLTGLAAEAGGLSGRLARAACPPPPLLLAKHLTALLLARAVQLAGWVED